MGSGYHGWEYANSQGRHRTRSRNGWYNCTHTQEPEGKQEEQDFKARSPSPVTSFLNQGSTSYWFPNLRQGLQQGSVGIHEPVRMGLIHTLAEVIAKLSLCCPEVGGRCELYGQGWRSPPPLHSRSFPCGSTHTYDLWFQWEMFPIILFIWILGLQTVLLSGTV